jgi:hypothetical protein
MGAMKRAFMANEDIIEQAAIFAEARPRLTLEAANMLMLLKAASNTKTILADLSEAKAAIEAAREAKADA